MSTGTLYCIMIAFPRSYNQAAETLYWYKHQNDAVTQFREHAAQWKTKAGVERALVKAQVFHPTAFISEI